MISHETKKPEVTMSLPKTIERTSQVKNSIGRLLISAVTLLIEALFFILVATRLAYYAEWILLSTRLVSFILVLLI